MFLGISIFFIVRVDDAGGDWVLLFLSPVKHVHDVQLDRQNYAVVDREEEQQRQELDDQHPISWHKRLPIYVLQQAIASNGTAPVWHSGRSL